MIAITIICWILIAAVSIAMIIICGKKMEKESLDRDKKEGRKNPYESD